MIAWSTSCTNNVKNTLSRHLGRFYKDLLRTYLKKITILHTFVRLNILWFAISTALIVWHILIVRPYFSMFTDLLNYIEYNSIWWKICLSSTQFDLLLGRRRTFCLKFWGNYSTAFSKQFQFLFKKTIDSLPWHQHLSCSFLTFLWSVFNAWAHSVNINLVRFFRITSSSLPYCNFLGIRLLLDVLCANTT